jgi:hypothetical protein
MFNRSEILTKAWADYRRDVKMGWGVRRGAAFNRPHFAYCLRMAWAVAKELAAVSAKPAAVVAPAKAVHPAAAARAAHIHSALFDLQMGDFVDWTRHSALSVELAQLAA